MLEEFGNIALFLRLGLLGVTIEDISFNYYNCIAIGQMDIAILL